MATNTSDEPIRIVKEVIGSGFVTARPGFHGHHRVIKVVADCDLSMYAPVIRCKLDEIGWQWVTLKRKESERVLMFGLAPIVLRRPTIAFHTTLKEVIPVILEHGLSPSTDDTRHTDFPDIVDRIHVTETLEGDGSAVHWIRIFSEKYGRAKSDYGILEIDLRGFDGRIFQDVHSQHGLVIDKIDTIPPHRLRLVGETMYQPKMGM